VSYYQYLMGLTTDYNGGADLSGPQARPQPEVLHLVEQQGKTYEEILAQWHQKDYWTGVHGQVDEIDALIEEFNARVGLL